MGGGGSGGEEGKSGRVFRVKCVGGWRVGGGGVA